VLEYATMLKHLVIFILVHLNLGDIQFFFSNYTYKHIIQGAKNVE